jgi:3-hydroxyisobutyrate dehydrogenase
MVSLGARGTLGQSAVRPVKKPQPLGWIGLGVMGGSMCGHLLRAGYRLTVHTRTRAKAAPQLAAGAVWADSPRAVAEASDVVFSMVGFPSDVREVALGPGGVLAGLRAGGILVDMTTSEPALALELALAARERGAWAIDAPVSGGDVGAREARLSIMAGGDAEAFAAVRPILEALGRTIVHQGGPGAGQHTKMVNQTLIASNVVGVCEGMLYAVRAGLDPERVLASVSGGAAGSWTLANLAPRMLAGDFAPGFYVEHFVKDMEIALREAERMQLALPGLALARQLYERLVAHGHARSGTQALVLALSEMSGVEWPEPRA